MNNERDKNQGAQPGNFDREQQQQGGQKPGQSDRDRQQGGQKPGQSDQDRQHQQGGMDRDKNSTNK
jgi:hypothetical protein